AGQASENRPQTQAGLGKKFFEAGKMAPTHGARWLWSGGQKPTQQTPGVCHCATRRASPPATAAKAGLRGDAAHGDFMEIYA
ncbi:hypothetical protein, partial [Cupriavidus basilensis]|uniref:hypothetical protein n=1 Tax=Cupriavidus basilensis TaxID=68895 RepID=UPI0023E8F414